MNAPPAERNFWEASDTYSAMSPFNHADKIKAPLLLIHSQADPNPGTFPMQSERLFAAIKGLGGQARLCLLPNEGHFYRARESILHVLAEQDAWLEKHVKHAQPKGESSSSSTKQGDTRQGGDGAEGRDVSAPPAAVPKSKL